MQHLSQMESPPKTVPLLTIKRSTGGKNSYFHFEKDKVGNIFESANGHPIALVSIFGNSGEGKSFFLSCLANALHRVENGEDFNIGFKEELPPQFSFTETNANKISSGLYITDRPFFLPQSKARKIAVYLVDTCGLSNRENTERDVAGLAAAAICTSSLLIYNTVHSVMENNLDMIAGFCEGTSLENKAFQKLLFLVRDWHVPDDFFYGFDGGRAYINRLLSAEEANQGSNTRRTIRDGFNEIDCCLLPRPGDCIRDCSPDLSNLNPLFQSKMRELILQMALPRYIPTKQSPLDSATNASSLEVVSILEQFVTGFNRDTTNSLHLSISEVNAKASHEITLSRCTNHFMERLKDIDASNVEGWLDRLKADVLEMFEKAKKLGSPDMTKSYQAILLKRMELKIKQLKFAVVSSVTAHAEKVLQEIIDDVAVKCANTAIENSPEEVELFFLKLHKDAVNNMTRMLGKCDSAILNQQLANLEDHLCDQRSQMNRKFEEARSLINKTRDKHLKKLTEYLREDITDCMERHGDIVPVEALRELCNRSEKFVALLGRKAATKLEEKGIMCKDAGIERSLKELTAETLLDLKRQNDAKLHLFRTTIEEAEKEFTANLTEQIKNVVLNLDGVQSDEIANSCFTELEDWMIKKKLEIVGTSADKFASQKTAAELKEEIRSSTQLIAEKLLHTLNDLLQTATNLLLEHKKSFQRHIEIDFAPCTDPANLINAPQRNLKQELENKLPSSNLKPSVVHVIVNQGSKYFAELIASKQLQYEAAEGEVKSELDNALETEFGRYKEHVMDTKNVCDWSNLKVHHEGCLKQADKQIANVYVKDCFSRLKQEALASIREKADQFWKENEPVLRAFRDKTAVEFGELQASERKNILPELDANFTALNAEGKKTFYEPNQISIAFEKIKGSALPRLRRQLLSKPLHKDVLEREMNQFDALFENVKKERLLLNAEIERQYRITVNDVFDLISAEEMSKKSCRSAAEAISCDEFVSKALKSDKLTKYGFSHQRIKDDASAFLASSLDHIPSVSGRRTQNFNFGSTGQTNISRRQQPVGCEAHPEIQQQQGDNNDQAIPPSKAPNLLPKQNVNIKKVAESHLDKFKLTLQQNDELEDEEISSYISQCIEKMKEELAPLLQDPDKIDAKCTEMRKKMESLQVEKVNAMQIERERGEFIHQELISNAFSYYKDEMQDIMSNMGEQSQFITPNDLNEMHKQAKFNLTRSSKLGKLSSQQVTEVQEMMEKHFQDLTLQTTELCNTEPAIGIDLGTTFSCVAIFWEGKMTVIPNSVGEKTTPSYVSFKEDGTRLVGIQAKKRAPIEPAATIFDAKRLIGRRHDDDVVQEDMRTWPFKVVEEVGKVKIEVRNKTYFPEQIGAYILVEMKEAAERFLNRPVKNAVITVPAYFDDNQRQATRDAGIIAGLNVIRIINEPTAAAFAYSLNRKNPGRQRNVLIYDLGGGTFDVSVLSMQGKVVRTLAVEGDSHLGGEDFDDRLLHHCVEMFEEEHGVHLLEGKDDDNPITRGIVYRRLRRLKEVCEKVKISLSAKNEETVELEAIYDSISLSVNITKAQFETLCADLFDKTLQLVERALEGANKRRNEIDEIVMVGGSTRIPRVRELLTTFFGKNLNHSVNADEAVAQGAALQAAVLTGNLKAQLSKNLHLDEKYKRLDDMTISDVTSFDIGIELIDGSFSPIIKKNTQIPLKEKETYTTSYDNQTSVLIAIYEGNGHSLQSNSKIGEFYLNGIPPGKAASQNLEVTMEVNDDGILQVSAKCTANGVSQSITVTEHKGRLTDAEKTALVEAPGQD